MKPIQAPPSKSYFQRMIAVAALSEGISTIENPSFCDDALSSISVAKALGAHVKSQNPTQLVIEGGILRCHKVLRSNISCGESGLAFRMFAPIAALFPQKIILTGKRTLLSRPVSMLEKPLRELGASCQSYKGKPPVIIHGPLSGGSITIDGLVTSQFLTGLLIALPLCREDSQVVVKNLKSKSYVRMTLDILKQVGAIVDYDPNLRHFNISGNQHYRALHARVEGDWSAASAFLVLGAIAGRLEVRNLNPESLQPDRKILRVLEDVGAKIRVSNNSVSVESNLLRSFEFDISDCPDLFPPLVVLGCFCEGKSTIFGTGRLRYKESNRARTMTEEFKKLGAKITLREKAVDIERSYLSRGAIESHNDHRVAMAAAIAAAASRVDISIENPQCVKKSYPEFFEVLDEHLRQSLSL